MKVNLLTGKVNAAADQPTNISKEDFYKYYFKMINMVKPIMTDREIDFLSVFCLNKDPEFIQSALKMSAPNYYGMVKRLVEKKLLFKQDTVLDLHPTFSKFINHVEKSNTADIIFVFPLKIE